MNIRKRDVHLMAQGKKFILILMATATALGLSANINSVPNVEAHHIKSYKIRRHYHYHKYGYYAHRKHYKYNKRYSHTKYEHKLRKLDNILGIIPKKNKRIKHTYHIHYPKRKWSRKKLYRYEKTTRHRKGLVYVLNGNEAIPTGSFKSMADKDEYSYGNEFTGSLVKIIGHKTTAGYPMVKIYDPDAHTTSWIYKGDLSKSKHATPASFSLPKLRDQLFQNHIDVNAPQYLDAMKTQTFKDINLDRISHGLSSLVPSDELNQLANERAQEIRSNFNHYPNGDSSQQAYVVTDAANSPYNLDLSRDGWGENIARPTFGKSQIYPNAINSHKTFQNWSGEALANCANDEMMNFDKFKAGDGTVENGGHRANLLNPGFQSVGVGVYHHPGDAEFYLAEEFGYQQYP